MEIILAFVLTTNAGMKIDYSPDHIFTSISDCAQFATNESRDLIIKRYAGRKGLEKVHRAVPACRRYTRQIAMQIKSESVGI
jgi:hypothetical protein